MRAFDNFGLPFLPNLIIKEHSLNIGRLAWYLTVPGLEGGKDWIDIIGNNNGLLNNMSSSFGWQGSYRPGGYGYVKFDGNNDNVSINVPVPLSYTVAAWTRMDGISNYPSVVGASPNNYLGFHFRNVRPRFYGLGLDLSISYDLNIGQWYRLMGMVDAGVMKLYIDGEEVASGSVSAPNTLISQTYTTIGSYANGNFFTGAIDDVSIWGRALTLSEIIDDLKLSRMNYVGLIRKKYRILDYSYLTDIIFPVSGNLATFNRRMNFSGHGTANPPMFSGTVRFNKVLNLSSVSGIVVPPILRGRLNLTRQFSLNSLGSRNVPVFVGSAQLIRSFELSTLTMSALPIFSGEVNIEVRPVIIVDGHYVIEAFMYKDVLYVTDYMDLGQINA